MLLRVAQYLCFVSVLNALAGCAEAPRHDIAQFSATDSAGVEVIHTGPISPSGDTLLAVEETLRLGVVEGPEHLQFFRVAALAVDHPRHLFVGDNGSGEIRVFTHDGEFVRVIGQRGAGPGEFQNIARILVFGDTLIVVDRGLARATAFGSDGQLLDSWSLVAGRFGVLPIHFGAHGWVVTIPTIVGGFRHEAGVARQDTTHIAVVGSLTAPLEAGGGADDPGSGTATRTVIRYPEKRVFGIEMPTGLTAGSPLWEPGRSHDVDGRGRVYVSHGFPYRIEVFDSTGTLIRRVERAHSPRPVSQALVDGYLAKVRAFFDTATARGAEWEIRRAAEIGRASLPRAGALPATGVLMVSNEGAMWIERPDMAEDPVMLEWVRDGRPESFWDVFAPSGRLVGTVQLPGTFTPLAVTETDILGVLEDELGVEQIVRYSLDPD